MDDQNKSMNEQWAPTESDARGYAQDEPGTDRRTAEIRADIERTRGEMSETIDAIQDRVRPSNVVSRAADNVREATVGKVREVAASVQRSMPDTSAATHNAFADRIRERPVVAAIAAGSLAWLMFGGRRSPNYGQTRSYGYSPGYAGEYDAYDSTYGTTRPTGYGYGENQSQSEGSWTEVGSETRDRVRSAAQDTREQMRRATSQARNRAQRLTTEQPLAAAGLAAIAGLAIGLMLPETERENQLMGEARDSMVERAREAARETAEKAKDVAKEVQNVATKAISATESSGGGTASGTNQS